MTESFLDANKTDKFSFDDSGSDKISPFMDTNHFDKSYLHAKQQYTYLNTRHVQKVGGQSRDSSGIC